MKIIVSFFFVLSCLVVNAQQLRIGVYRDFQMKRIVFAYNDGSYTINADTTDFGSILPNEFVELSAEGSTVRLKVGVVDKGVFSKIHLHQNFANSSMTLNPKNPVSKQRKYEDDFEIISTNGVLTIVNLVDMENYLAGVVESEGGGGQPLEYYKVQALMSRTYALKYLSKHKKEGFSLCDRVHCQAYHSMMRFTPLIDSAVKTTPAIVMVDNKNNFVDSYFHANCGGQTCEPDYVWNNAIPYLKTFVDTFCIYTKQSKWEKRVSKAEWERYLVKEFNFPINDSTWASQLYTFEQEQRKAFYINPVLGIPLRDLRTEFGLKSTFFSCRLEGTDVVIYGRGFGHGVGLCQEGAMKMAKYGFDYRQIALFYFPGIHIVNLREVEYFKQVTNENFE